uniref:Uncharacterized protein n=1 Tax=Setaria italica TaxID=4555 RepID=K3ZJD0_SETIT
MERLATAGGGGDIGKKIGHGGGDGGDDDGDDDDYFDDFEDGDEEGGFFKRRIVIQELFNREFIDAVLQEWYKSMSNLPAGLRQAYEMGLVSSAQMVQYLSIFGRPTKARYFSRAFPSFFSRGLVGRMLADPSFLHKMTLEFLATITSSVWWEMENRKERFQQELDLVFVNVFTATICNLAVFCCLAPCRSYTIQRVPNNIFEKSYPMRQFDLLRRTQSFFSKAAQLCLGGLVVGSIQVVYLKSFLLEKKGCRYQFLLSALMLLVMGLSMGCTRICGIRCYVALIDLCYTILMFLVLQSSSAQR